MGTEILFLSQRGHVFPTVRKLDWEALVWSNWDYALFGFKVKVKVKSLSCVRLFVTPWTVGYRLLPPWDSPVKNTGMGCCFLLQGIFPTQGSNPGLPHCRQMQADALTSEPPRKSIVGFRLLQIYFVWAYLRFQVSWEWNLEFSPVCIAYPFLW